MRISLRFWPLILRWKTTYLHLWTHGKVELKISSKARLQVPKFRCREWFLRSSIGWWRAMILPSTWTTPMSRRYSALVTIPTVRISTLRHSDYTTAVLLSWWTRRVSWRVPSSLMSCRLSISVVSTTSLPQHEATRLRFVLVFRTTRSWLVTMATRRRRLSKIRWVISSADRW